METGSLDDFIYAEVSMDGKTYVPCLMIGKRTEQSIIRTFSKEEACCSTEKPKENYVQKEDNPDDDLPF